jgi:hypothetical protein
LHRHHDNPGELLLSIWKELADKANSVVIPSGFGGSSMALQRKSLDRTTRWHRPGRQYVGVIKGLLGQLAKALLATLTSFAAGDTRCGVGAPAQAG